jgi:hypothetical protein
METQEDQIFRFFSTGKNRSSLLYWEKPFLLVFATRKKTKHSNAIWKSVEKDKR